MKNQEIQLNNYSNSENNQELNQKIYEYRVQGLSWGQIVKLVESEGVYLTKDACRKRCKRWEHKLTESYYEGDLEESSIDESKVDKYNFNDYNTTLNALYRRIAREDSIREIATYAVDTVKDLIPLKDSKPKIITGDREAILILSDWHYGMEVENHFNKYNPDVAQERIQQLLTETTKYISKYGIKKLYVLNLGDLISGNIHLQLRINNRFDVLTQIMKVSELLSEFLNILSNYAQVEYYSVIDNHSRLDPNKKESIQLENLCRITDWYISQRVSNINCHIDNEWGETMCCFKTDSGLQVVGVHGDKDKLDKVVPTMSTFTQSHVDLICSAHLHHFYVNEENNTLSICNGSLIGTDDYAFTKRLLSVPSQTLIVINKRDVEEILRIKLN